MRRSCKTVFPKYLCGIPVFLHVDYDYMTRLSFGLTGAHDDTETYLTGGELAEEYGYDSIWFAEDYFFRDTFTTATAVAMETSELDIGVFVNPYTRHPSLTAMSAASLDEIADGDVRIAMGAGPRVVMDGISDYENPLWTVKESVEVIRELLDGGQSYSGDHFDFEGVSLGHCEYMPYMGEFTPPRNHIPIQIAAVGPQMLKMAGDIGDGLSISVGFPPALVEESIERAAEGLAINGRNPESFEVSVFLFAADEITPRARQFTAMTVGAANDLETMLRIGYDEDEVTPIRETFETDGLEAAAELVPDHMVSDFVLVGDREACHEQLDRYVDVGTDEIILLHLGPNDPKATLELGATWSP